MLYLKACRSCLTTEGILERMTPNMRRQFILITGLEVEEGDGFPQYLCAECYVHTKKAVQFRRRSKRAHFVLKEIKTVKGQVCQADLVTVDRQKTNLISQYSYWKPELAATFSYTTLDSVNNLPTEGLTPDIEKALNDSLTTNSNTNNSQIKNTTNTEDSKTFLTKEKLTAINKSLIRVDIKPANWEEIEKEEEEVRKRLRQKEIEEALREIHDEDCAGDNHSDDGVQVEDIDMEDIFKGLKEDVPESDYELSELETTVEVFKKQPKGLKNSKKQGALRNNKEKAIKDKRYPLYLRDINKEDPDFLKGVEIRYLSKEEQCATHAARTQHPAFKMAVYKCGICCLTFTDIQHIYQHVAYHNTKLSFKYACDVCKDRWETEYELTVHLANTHWYRYTCTCRRVHNALKPLIACLKFHKTGNLNEQEKVKENEDTAIAKYSFKLKAVKPKAMYSLFKKWKGVKSKTRKQYVCQICKISFLLKNELYAHRALHRGVHSGHCYWCDICSAQFVRLSALERHMRHWHLYTYTCNACTSVHTFNNWYEANAHYKTNHTEKVQCSYCKTEFDTPNKLSFHLGRRHRVECGECDVTHRAARAHRLYKHQLDVHGYLRLVTVPDINDPRYHCEECAVYFRSEDALYRHLARERHVQADTYTNACQPCHQLFATAEELAKHKQSCPHTDKQTCVEECEDSQSCRTHQPKNQMQVVKCSTTYQCETCGMVMGRYKWWKHNHKARPPAARHVSCRFCPTRSPTPALHVSHVLANHTHKPYCCTLCGARYHTRTMAREHILKTHAPVRPYSCEACARDFAHLDFLQQHCRKFHDYDLKRTDKSVFLSKRMFGKIYVYPHLKIDGSLIDISIIEKVPVEVCDYMDENNKPIDYQTAFFFDPTVDPSTPTKEMPFKRKKMMKPLTKEQTRIKYEKQKLKKRLLKEQQDKQNATEDNKFETDDDEIIEDTEQTQEEIKMDVKYDYFGNVITEDDIKDDSFSVKEQNEDIEEMQIDTAEENAEYEDPDEDVKEDMEVETEDVVGQLIEQDGEQFVLVDGILYKFEL